VPGDWMELATYGLNLPTPINLYVGVAVPSGTDHERRQELVKAGREAGWDAVLLVNAVRAAAEGLKRSGAQAVVVIDGERSSIGLCEGGRLQTHDHVSQILGREAREVAISLRCLLKDRPKEEQRQLLKNVVVVGDRSEIERVGRRHYERELADLGSARVEFELDPFLIAQGAALIALNTQKIQWRRLRRAQR
jgi:hypothetical protein